MERTDLTAQPLSFCPVIPPAGEPQPVTQDKEGNVWVNIRADHASRVAMRIYEEEYPFEKGDDGIWHLKYPFRDGIVYVQLLIDGMEVMTPYLPVCYGYSRPYNCIMLEETEERYDVPEGESGAAELAGTVDFYRLKDVPHGAVRREYYLSSVTGEWESALVYTPPGYDENTDRVYPVLYLQHGHGENETGWTAAGKVNFILDNLIAEGKAVPFLVIMNNGMVQTAAGERRRVVDHTLFSELLMKDIIPWAQSRFRIGEAVLELTQIGKECHSHCEIYKKMGDCIMPREGVFTEVVKGGLIHRGDAVEMEAPSPDRPYTAAVITLSDKGIKGEREDKSGPKICELAEAAGYEIRETLLLADGIEPLKSQLIRLADQRQMDVIFTTGGTGFSERDLTPEATIQVCDRMANGIADAIRNYSMTITPRAMFSRAVSGIRGKTLIINLPGSPKAVEEALEFLLPQLDHGLDILRGTGGECAR